MSDKSKTVWAARHEPCVVCSGKDLTVFRFDAHLEPLMTTLCWVCLKKVASANLLGLRADISRFLFFTRQLSGIQANDIVEMTLEYQTGIDFSQSPTFRSMDWDQALKKASARGGYEQFMLQPRRAPEYTPCTAWLVQLPFFWRKDAHNGRIPAKTNDTSPLRMPLGVQGDSEPSERFFVRMRYAAYQMTQTRWDQEMKALEIFEGL